MGVDISLTQQLVPSAGLSYPLGVTQSFYLSVANDLQTGIGTGPAVQVTVYGPGSPDGYTVLYGGRQGKQFKGNLIVITGAGAYVEVVAKPSQVDATLQLIGSATSTGSIGSALSATIGTAVGTVYTCPAGYKAILLRATIGGTVPGDLLYLYAEADAAASPPANDWITSQAGLAFPAGLYLKVGFGPGNDVQLIGPIILLPGDTIQGTVSANTAEITVEFLLIPL